MNESTVIDAIPTGGTEVPVIAQGMPLDILNRQEFVDRVFNLIEAIASQRGSCTFAIDGAWGSGKTFVLNMLEPKLREYQDGDKYLVFHYNCWQYDYYEEPLVAIVSALLDTLTNPKLVKAGAVVDGVLTTLKGITDDLMSLIFNVKLFEHVDAGKKKAGEAEAAAHSFDQYFGFKKVMTEARTALEQLAEGKTLVIVVDELDRCLPEYAIKVLERLHHLFTGLDNSVVALAVDKKQLDNTVKQIFGAETKTDEYLKKFINFQLLLDSGKVTPGFREKYHDYTELFDESLTKLTFDIDKYIVALFSSINARTQEQLIEHAKIAHITLFGNTKKDYIFMCSELLWVVVKQHYKIGGCPIQYSSKDEGFVGDTHLSSELRTFIAHNGNDEMIYFVRYQDNSYGCRFREPLDSFHLLIWYISQLSLRASSRSHIQYELDCSEQSKAYCEQVLTELASWRDLLRLLKF